MKRLVVVIISMLLSFSCVVRKVNKEPEYRTQWGVENARAEEFFKKEYKSGTYPQYKGQVSVVFDNGHYGFYFDGRKIVIDDNDFMPVFERGLLYPDIFGVEDRELSVVFREVISGHKMKNSRRYRVSVFRKNKANPLVYLVEFTNKKATPKDDIKTFMANAAVTFFDVGWVQI